MENDLTLSEKLLLLAIRPGKGGIMGLASQSLDFGLVGAVILELALDRRVNVTNKYVEILTAQYNNPAQGYLLEKMALSSRPRKITHWMNSMVVSKRKLKSAVYESLVQKKEVKLEDRHFLFFRWKKPFLSPVHHASQVIFKVKDLVIGGSDNPEDIYLLTLLEAAYLLRRIYPDCQSRRSVKKKIKQFETVHTNSETVKQAIENAKAVKASIAISIAASHARHA
jgi:hypothetical protein